jgi:glycosyltransferase involved in cell wall biosynthesis
MEAPRETVRLVVCWPEISGYMAACWKALTTVPGIDLRLIAHVAPGGTFDAALVEGLNVRLLAGDERDDVDLIASLVREREPDLLYLTGWFNAAYRTIARSPEFANIPKWMGLDTPWRATLRQQLGRVALRRYVALFEKVFVPGERAWQYARMLGAPERKIRRALYGIDFDGFAPLYDRRARLPGGWPKRFLFVGRYHEEKGIPTLVDAYRRYRAAVSDPWPLTTCGGGPLEGLLRGDGIENLGFRQPAEVRDIMRNSGAFVLASHVDPWPLVVVESSAAGLPVLCTETCGSAVELVRPYYSGLMAATADAEMLARGMRWLHEHHADLPQMGARGRELAAAYSAQMWAKRWAEAAREPAVG